MSSLASGPAGFLLSGFDRHYASIAGAAFFVCALVAVVLVVASQKRNKVDNNSGISVYLRFIYASFLKPHDKGCQLTAPQATVYDATRKRLLRGREDMLGLVAAQLKYKVENKELRKGKAIWVDIGGGTGSRYNIEAMAEFVPVPEFFSHVYLVDLSPSLLEVARQRFERLGWKNVTVVCQDARAFQLPEDHIDPLKSVGAGADLVTMSYSLSMIPVQSIVDVSSRNYIGGVFNRHVNWLGRAFWRAWFEADRVNLDAARRDYLEYRFGTVISASERNYLLGGIPYYIFIGRQKDIYPNQASREAIEKLDASFTESPYLSPANHREEMNNAIIQSTQEIHSKAYESAVVNLSANLPLPAAFYQNHHYRIFYNDLLPKHTQFKNEYIYAFNWEDPRVDHRLLNIKRDDVILAITSAGDNILDYLQKSPRRVHAVDLNPNQNHLIELKVASFIALGHRDVWKIFGEGKHPEFRNLLISRLSPHLSSQAFQYWLEHSHVFTSSSGRGLYETGGSRHAIKMIRYIFKVFGLEGQVKKLCEAQTLAEQRQIWPRIRAVLLSKPLHWAVVSTEWFAWKAAGVPRNQRNMIVEDYFKRNGLTKDMKNAKDISGKSIWEYVVDTLDPVVHETMISNDNYFYYLCLKGQFSKRCAPAYLSPQAHVKLSSPGAFDGLRIHTDEINEVIGRITPRSLTIAVIMDSMDWFDPEGTEATAQAQKFNQALKMDGRILLRSASIEPWYIKNFEENGFSARRVGARFSGTCIDRVNMYASTWICTKTRELQRPTQDRRSNSVEYLEI
ncbi:hypothetical protein AN5914.2 [Aspergillus nidulans FGSC A4]|uniref:Methyltransferase domain-containing protein n=1 Tax=Emericella nidulans (strain FGSC A4 / ATCC 38163 / CBS 112.46 / NRRL 194 / M139) TaxID=227321 RepID=Q5B0L6_EMENI|nr:hypothetical protein [Aspergillus nidulans FGSC A4]EAA57777.1 hypothetical protein AN5914.2 [Aspergillus nidulans FGSC A4]CBF70581.1 TPA: conserved hypothetical protein [Aspergillus nidulans FGSC A4]|eukprot:XP_663518.1 hypothetical protein AN5914.2 [Aspergillus nidulans FGSC A4]